MTLRRLVSAASLLSAACVVWAAVQVLSATTATAWWPIVACVGLAAAGWSLQMAVRVGSQRLIFAWGAGAVAMALVLEPAWWVVLTTATGMVLATFVPPGRPPIKAGYNSAIYTLGATAAAVVYRTLQHDLPHYGRLWPGLVALLSAASAFLVVVDVGVQTVLGVVADKRFARAIRDDLGGRLLQAGAELGIVACIGAAAAIAPQWLYAVPFLAVCLQLAHRGAVAAAAERASTRRIFDSIQAISVAPDEVTTAQRAAQQLLDLLTADCVEVRLPGEEYPPRHEVLVRATRDAAPYIGSPREADPVAVRYLAVQEQMGEEAPVEVRVYFRNAVALNDRETAAVRILAAALNVALATARAHADLALMAAQAAHDASHDHVTGLPDHRLFLSRIADHLYRDEQVPAGPAALLVLRISGWPDLLEACGPDVGEQVLRLAARRLQDHAILGELVANLGADTFAVFLSDAGSARHALNRARMFLQALAQPVPVDSGPLALAGAAGFAYVQPHEVTAEELLRRARVALRHAHHRGRDLETYRPDDDTRGPAAAIVRSDLHLALASGQLELHYEPVYDLLTRQPVAVEAFPRWRHPDRGLVPDLDWIDLVDASAFLRPYLEWLLRDALAAWADWHTRVPVPVTVNIPGRALLDPGLPATVTTALHHANAPRHALGLEIAEAGALWTIETVDRLLLDLADSGTPLTIEDFGSAHSSIARLRRVPATEIKLAAEYSHDILTDDHARAIISAVVGLADQLDMRITATDLSNDDDTEALTLLGVHCGQGSALQGPVPAAQILPVLLTAQPRPPATTAEVITLRSRRHGR